MSEQHRTDRPAPDTDGDGTDGDGTDREVLTGRIVTPGDGGPEAAGGDGGSGGQRGGRRTASMVAGDLAGSAADRARQVSELLSGTARLLGGVMGASAVAGGVAALVVTGLLDAAFGWSWITALVVLVVLALPALEVTAHRALLLSAYGDPARLRKRFTDLPDATVGRVRDFTGRMAGLRADGPGRSGRVFRAARSAGALRGIAGVVPELTGVLLLPFTKVFLVVTGVAAVVCWALLVVTPLVAVVALIAALAG